MNCSNEWEHWEHRGSTIFKKSAPIENPLMTHFIAFLGALGAQK